MLKFLETLLTVVIGVGAAVVVYYLLNKLSEVAGPRLGAKIRPYLFIAPAILVVAVYLLYPTIQTIFYSFANADSTKIVGLQNYVDLLVNNKNDFHGTLFNTLIWIIVAPAATIVLGLLVATLADKLHARGEKFSKSLVFAPMAIGAVGAGTIWKFVYSQDPNVGLQNAIWSKFGDPINWLADQSFHLNTLEIIVVFLWTQIGFAMVLLSAAIKGVPVDTLEAARIDGANELQIFFRVVVPQIRVTIATVFITVLISTLKIFDVVYVLAGGQGNFNTNVIGLEFFNQQNVAQNQGYAATIVVILLAAISPVMVYQVRQFRAQEAAR